MSHVNVFARCFQMCPAQLHRNLNAEPLRRPTSWLFSEPEPVSVNVFIIPAFVPITSSPAKQFWCKCVGRLQNVNVCSWSQRSGRRGGVKAHMCCLRVRQGVTSGLTRFLVPSEVTWEDELIVMPSRYYCYIVTRWVWVMPLGRSQAHGGAHKHRFTPRAHARKLSLTRRLKSTPRGAIFVPLVANVALIHRLQK